MKQIRTTKSKFIRVRCPKCNSEQAIFGKATTKVKCLKCGQQLTKPTASKAKIKAKVLEVFK
ncbi:MAG: 30S ribosomal protein S27e [Candidatus Pacearchaeota archaeon]|nr:MAG: 30S ribosomal protein S27e [Candidatus Pacearchaeota archaeon]